MRAFGWLGMFALIGATPGCGGQTFSCTRDSGCGDDGRCEADGWCSFPDATCPSGRRYAEFSGGDVAKTCVGTTPQASSSGGPTTTAVGMESSGTTGASSSSGAVSTENSTGVDSTTTSVGTETGVSATCPGDTCATSMSTDSSGSTTSSESTESSSDETTGDPPPCPGFWDDFDDGAFDPSWEAYGAMGMGGHVMAEAGGELRWDFAPNIVEQRGLNRPFDGPVSSIVVHVTQTAELAGAQAQTVLLFREQGGPADLHLVWSNDMVQVRNDGENVADSSTFEWVEIRFEAGGVEVSTSSDGTDFDLLTSIDGNFGGGGLQRVWLYGQTWTEAPAAASAAFGSIRVCEP